MQRTKFFVILDHFLPFPGPNLDLSCVQQSDAAPFFENYPKLYFDAKQLEKGLNRGGEIFGALFFFFKKKRALSNQYQMLP